MDAKSRRKPINGDALQSYSNRFERRHAMKQKVGKAVQLMIAVTMEDIGFFIACGIALVILLKLACV